MAYFTENPSTMDDDWGYLHDNGNPLFYYGNIK